MPLPLPNQVVIPSTQEKVYDTAWIYNLSVHAPSNNAGRITIEVLPYNQQTQEIAPGSYVQTIHTDKLFQAMAEVPEVQQAFGAILNAIEPLRTWVAAQQAVPPAPPTPEPEPAPAP